jgi:hypothetical protein
MTSTKQQTAVEWLAKSYVDLLTKLNNEEISLEEFEIQYIKLLNQAREMHKEQIIKAVVWFDETDRRPCEIEKDAEQYYNETYGGNK